MGQPGMMPGADSSQTYQNTGAMQIPAGQAPLSESTSVEELMKVMTYEQATQVIIKGNGKFGNKTMGQVAIESPSSVKWFAYDYTGNDNRIPAAARIILKKAVPMAG